MIKIIKHIIKSCAAISLLAMTLFSCSQTTVPEPKPESEQEVFSIKSFTIPEEALENKSKTVLGIIKGTGFSKDNLKNFSIECNTNEIIKEPNFTYKDNSTITVNLTIPSAIGTYPITIKNGIHKITTELVVKDTYSVSFKSDYGTVPEKITGLSKGDKVNIPAITENIPGYNFMYWYDHENDKRVNTNKNETIEKSIKLTAVWEPVKFTISYENCEYADNKNATKYNITKCISLSDPIKNGHKFEGWFNNKDFNGEKITTIPEGTTGDKTLYAKWTELPPDVTNFKVLLNGTTATLTWEEPSNEKFDHIIISYKDNQPITVAKGIKTVKIENVNKEIVFTIKTIDSKNLTSMGISGKDNTLTITEKPKFIRQEIIKETPYDIVIFGDWPQTVKNKSVTIDSNKETKNINGWSCYLGSDGFYYTKETVYLPSNKSSVILSDSKTYNSGDTVYFKMEPIEWRVLTKDYNGTKTILLLAEKTLMTGKFANSFGEQNIHYYESELRSRLNGLDKVVSSPNGQGGEINFKDSGFLQKAFSKNAIKLIADTEVHDSSNLESDVSNIIVKDKIFVLSKEELENVNYGFLPLQESLYNNSRFKDNTDYTKATGVLEDQTSEKRSPWWTRTCFQQIRSYGEEEWHSYFSYRADPSGTITATNKNTADSAIVPALCLKCDYNK